MINFTEIYCDVSSMLIPSLDPYPVEMSLRAYVLLRSQCVMQAGAEWCPLSWLIRSLVLNTVILYHTVSS